MKSRWPYTIIGTLLVLALNVPPLLSQNEAQDNKPVSGVRITLDQTITNGWNEIDAVELVGLTTDEVVVRQWAISAEASSQYGSSSNWSPAQATGAPDTAGCGDQATAWASATSTGQDTLTLSYDTPVIPLEVNIYQTYHPGAIVRVELLEGDSATLTIFEGVDPALYCPGVLSIRVRAEAHLETLAYGVRIKINQAERSWTEIDAIELVGLAEDGALVRQWAGIARASSRYGSGDTWSPARATGAPDSLGCGDQSTAWASATAKGIDTLTAFFAKPVYPIEVNVYQNSQPGQIVRVDVLLADGTPPLVFTDLGDLTPFCPNVLRLNLARREVLHMPMFWTNGATIAGDPAQAILSGYANSIAYSQTVEGEIIDAGVRRGYGFDDWIFYGAIGDTLTITMQGTQEGNLDSLVFLIDDTDKIIARNDDAAPGSFDATLADIVLPSTGVYTIRASGSGGSVGAYTLTLQGKPAESD
ncbi:MAG: hypothetical protein JXB47_11265 [Anaerolineae bacterium]|nr:hypothetical protein [Anaerolineae bacterium]